MTENSKETNMKTMIKTLAMLLAVLSSPIAMADIDITGTWQGDLAINSYSELRIQFIISQDTDDSYAVVLHTPGMGNIKNVEANEVVYNAGNLKVDVAELNGSFEGVVREGKIEGEWKQEGTSFPLVLMSDEKPTLTEEEMGTLLGTWKGKPVSPEGATMEMPDPTCFFQFEMSEQGVLTGIMSVPEFGIPDSTLSDIGIRDGIFSFEISDGTQEFIGELTDNKIIGKLKYPFNPNAIQLITLVKVEEKVPVYNLVLPEEIKDQLIGSWNGILKMPGPMETTTVAVFRFEISKHGDFLGFVDMLGGSGLKITEANMSDGKLILKLKSIRGEVTGSILTDKIVGEWTEEMGSTPLTLDRGPYVAPEYTLNLPEETMTQLMGKWNGKFDDRDVAIWFEKAENGDFKGFAKMPMFGGSNDKPIMEASVSEGKLTLKIGGEIPLEFTADLSGDQLAGNLKETTMGINVPLTMVKERPES